MNQPGAPSHMALNYQHLRYFWVVAREGSVTRAAKKLRLTQPTVSAQLHALEEAIGEKLFRKDGRRLVLTDGGRSALRFADEIFALGTELVDTVRGRLTGRPTRLAVGVADDVPKTIAYRILEPAMTLPEPVRVVVHEGPPDRLVAELDRRTLDMVISEAPASASTTERVFNHPLGECGLSVFAEARLAKRLKKGFPRSLDAAPLLLPTPDTVLRRQIDQWLEDRGIVPDVVGELQDAALLSVFGEAGRGAFVAPDAIGESGIASFAGNVRRVGAMKPLRQRFYAITVERRLVHPAVQAIAGAAREDLFGRTRPAGGDRS
jgi:LysR family transcriptional activator of nhaA